MARESIYLNYVGNTEEAFNHGEPKVGVCYASSRC